MMNHNIELTMTRADADCVQQIFDEAKAPDFTIASKRDIGNYVRIVLYCESYVTFWYLAKQVQNRNHHTQLMADLKDLKNKK